MRFKSLDEQLSHFTIQFKFTHIAASAIAEAKKRVLDSLGCFYGAFQGKPGRLLRESFLKSVDGEVSLWGTNRRVPAELAVWANGTCVRTLDYNDTYLSLEPCHPSDLIAPLWAACELSGSRQQGQKLLKAMILGYEVLGRLCDAKSIRIRGWDHVTYLPIASAVACSYILGLNPEQARHAIALSMVGNNALRQTRVGTISDWKAACGAYAARCGLWAARLAKNGFTGPSDIFSGKNGFFNQVSGPFEISKKPWGHPWKIMETHTKFFPAEHHAQSAIECAIQLRTTISRRPGNSLSRAHFKNGSWIGTFQDDGLRIVIDTFDVAVSIIGSEKEKWMPGTRETADHSMPYLVAVALLDGDVTLDQYKKKRFLDSDVKALIKRVRVKHFAPYSKRYPKEMPTRVSIHWKDGRVVSSEIMRPKGYAGRPMSLMDVERKFHRLASPLMADHKRKRLVEAVLEMDRLKSLEKLTALMRLKNL